MLGNLQDAEDASQEILIKVITSLSTFRKESAFSTWVYRIAVNYLLNVKKSQFANRPLSFEFYGSDIDAGFIPNDPAITKGVDESLLTEELKMSCTNVMLQCFDPQSRVIYVLGVMFRIDSKICGEILDISAEAYRKRLSRIREQMATFLKQYCGLTASGKCNCQKRIGYAINTHRLNPAQLEYTNLKKADVLRSEYTNAMERMDELSFVFSELPSYRSPDTVRHFVTTLLHSDSMQIIKSTTY